MTNKSIIASDTSAAAPPPPPPPPAVVQLAPALVNQDPALAKIVSDMQSIADNPLYSSADNGYSTIVTFNQIVTAINAAPSFAAFLNTAATTPITLTVNGQPQTVMQLSAIVPLLPSETAAYYNLGGAPRTASRFRWAPSRRPHPRSTNISRPTARITA